MYHLMSSARPTNSFLILFGEASLQKLKKSTIIGEKVNGGLKIIDFGVMEIALEISWIQRIQQNSDAGCPSKLCRHACCMHATCMQCMHEACMRHASKLAHLHAFSCMNEECMHASGMKICMHVTILEQLIMHENACRICMHALIR